MTTGDRAGLCDVILRDCEQLLDRSPLARPITFIDAPAGFGKSYLLDQLHESVTDNFADLISIHRVDFRTAPPASMLDLLLSIHRLLLSTGLELPAATKTARRVMALDEKLQNEAGKRPELWTTSMREAKTTGRSLAENLLMGTANSLAPGSGAILEPVVRLIVAAGDPVLELGFKKFCGALAAQGQLAGEDHSIARDPAPRLAASIASDLAGQSLTAPILVILDTVEEAAPFIDPLWKMLMSPSCDGEVKWVLAGQGTNESLLLPSGASAVPIDFRSLEVFTLPEVETVVRQSWPEATDQDCQTILEQSLGIPLLVALILQSNPNPTELTRTASAARAGIEAKFALTKFVQNLLRSASIGEQRLIVLLAVSRQPLSDPRLHRAATRLNVLEAAPRVGRLLRHQRLHASVEDAVRIDALNPAGVTASIAADICTAWLDELEQSLATALESFDDAYRAYQDRDVAQLVTSIAGLSPYVPTHRAIIPVVETMVFCLAPSDRLTARALQSFSESASRTSMPIPSAEQSCIRLLMLLTTGELIFDKTPIFWYEYRGASAQLEQLAITLEKLAPEGDSSFHAKMLSLQVAVRSNRPPVSIATYIASFNSTSASYKAGWGDYARWVFGIWFASQEAIGGRANPAEILPVIAGGGLKHPGVVIRLMNHPDMAAHNPLRLIVAEKLLDRHPFDSGVALLATGVLIDFGRSEAALEACIRCLQSGDDNAAMLYQAAYSAICCGETRRAATFVAELIALTRRDREAADAYPHGRLQALALMISGLSKVLTHDGDQRAGEYELGDDPWATLYIRVALFVSTPDASKLTELRQAVHFLRSGSAHDRLVALLYEYSLLVAEDESSTAELVLEAGLRELHRETPDGLPPAPEMVVIGSRIAKARRAREHYGIIARVREACVLSPRALDE